MNDITLVKKIAQIAYDKKGVNILAYDLQGISDLTRYTIICSGGSDRQVKAIAEAIRSTLKEQDKTIPFAVEGLQTGNWILLDYGTVIVNIFLEYIRNYYALEQLWPNAKQVDLELKLRPNVTDTKSEGLSL